MAKGRRRASGLQKVIAANIKRLRTAKGCSQEELGHICGYHRTYVGMIERGDRNISIATLEALAVALDVEPHRLLLIGVRPFDPALRQARRLLGMSGLTESTARCVGPRMSFAKCS